VEGQREVAVAEEAEVARDLLDRISDLLQDMPAPGDDEYPIHWGHVGDINHVNALLGRRRFRRPALASGLRDLVNRLGRLPSKPSTRLTKSHREADIVLL
jgi:hypothetical protein